jgi:4-hydroxybenzoate polyprenyltransferase
VVSGLVKSSGPIAAVLAVDPHPSPLFLGVLFAWVFLWEIGGQNVPNDWIDLDEDRRVGARTIPVLLGETGAIAVIGGALAAAMAVGVLALRLSPGSFGAPVQATVLAAGLLFLAAPAWELRRSPGRAAAAALFNRASWYPIAVLAIVLARLAF